MDDKMTRYFKQFIGANSVLGTDEDVRQDDIYGHRFCPDAKGAKFAFYLANKIRGRIPKFHELGTDDKSILNRDIHGRRICFVDVCPDVDILKWCCQNALSVAILDHHVTSLKILEDLGDVYPNLYYLIDTSRSAAQIAWDWCAERVREMKEFRESIQYIREGKCIDIDGHRPWFVEIIADRDLNKWEIPYSLQIGKAMYASKLYTPEVMFELFGMPTDDIYQKIEDLIIQGEEIMVKEMAAIQDACQKASRRTFRGYTVVMTIVDREWYSALKSEIARVLLSTHECDFASVVTFDEASQEYWVANRAADNSPIDLTCPDIGAKGHAHAAGLTIFKKIPVMRDDKALYGDLDEHFIQ